MPPTRFGIRTIVFVITALAVLIVAALLISEFRVIAQARGVAELALQTFPLSQIIPVAVFAAVLFVLLVEFLVFWDRFWSRRSQVGQISRKSNRQSRRLEQQAKPGVEESVG
jgi:uncharacterized membrane protein YedE/YeeE